MLYEDAIKDNIPEEITDAAEIQQQHKGPRPETGAMSGKQETLYEALRQTYE
jgi:hypothetical protein